MDAGEGWGIRCCAIDSRVSGNRGDGEAASPSHHCRPTFFFPQSCLTFAIPGQAHPSAPPLRRRKPLTWTAWGSPLPRMPGEGVGVIRCCVRDSRVSGNRGDGEAASPSHHCRPTFFFPQSCLTFAIPGQAHPSAPPLRRRKPLTWTAWGSPLPRMPGEGVGVIRCCVRDSRVSGNRGDGEAASPSHHCRPTFFFPQSCLTFAIPGQAHPSAPPLRRRQPLTWTAWRAPCHGCRGRG